MDKKESKLIHIPAGAPFWGDSLMKNLYILEELAGSGSGGEGGDVDLTEVKEAIEKVKQEHKEDVENIKESIGDVYNKIFGELGLAEQVGVHGDEINTIKKMLESIEGIEDITEITNTIKLLEEALQVIEGDIRAIRKDISGNKDEITGLKGIVLSCQKDIKNIISDLKSAQELLQQQEAKINNMMATVKENSETIGEHGLSLGELTERISSSHHVVNTRTQMELIDKKEIGSFCFVRETRQVFVWDNRWVETSVNLATGGVDWGILKNKPTSEVVDIDNAVEQAHKHGNKDALDAISYLNIYKWDNKADKGDVPTKLSELEDDIGAGGNYDEVIEKIEKTIGNTNSLTTEEKGSLVGAINEMNSKINKIEEMESMVQTLSEKVAYLEK